MSFPNPLSCLKEERSAEHDSIIHIWPRVVVVLRRNCFIFGFLSFAAGGLIFAGGCCSLSYIYQGEDATALFFAITFGVCAVIFFLIAFYYAIMLAQPVDGGLNELEFHNFSLPRFEPVYVEAEPYYMGGQLDDLSISEQIRRQQEEDAMAKRAKDEFFEKLGRSRIIIHEVSYETRNAEECCKGDCLFNEADFTKIKLPENEYVRYGGVFEPRSDLIDEVLP